MSDKADDSVGHLTNTLARGGGNLNDPIFKSSNARALPGGGVMLKFRVDRRIITSFVNVSAQKTLSTRNSADKAVWQFPY